MKPVTKRPADGLGTQIRRLLDLLDGDLQRIYREEHPYYTPRFTPVMKALARQDHCTIKEIAALSSISHSAASQTVAKLKDHGLVTLTTDTDRRNRRVSLSHAGQALLPWLEHRWAATKAAAEELDNELSHPLSQILSEAIQKLEAHPFAERINRHTDQMASEEQPQRKDLVDV